MAERKEILDENHHEAVRAIRRGYESAVAGDVPDIATAILSSLLMDGWVLSKQTTKERKMPKRVQMRRDRPWRKDNPDAVVVARPSPFGNPFTFHAAEDAGHTRHGAVMAFEDWLYGNPWGCPSGDTYEARRQELLRRLPELRGKDLACWCRASQECHADVLLRLANQ